MAIRTRGTRKRIAAARAAQTNPTSAGLTSPLAREQIRQEWLLAELARCRFWCSAWQTESVAETSSKAASKPARTALALSFSLGMSGSRCTRVLINQNLGLG